MAMCKDDEMSDSDSRGPAASRGDDALAKKFMEKISVAVTSFGDEDLGCRAGLELAGPRRKGPFHEAQPKARESLF